MAYVFFTQTSSRFNALRSFCYFDRHVKKLDRLTQVKGEVVEPLYGEIAIAENKLERFANRTQVRRYTIEFTCPEFTCLCPRSGFPDFATIQIRYVPHEWCVELKSLKLYINGFRNQRTFHEDVTNLILDDLVQLLDPWEIEVVGDFTVRGNIKTIVTSTHRKNQPSMDV